MAKRKSEPRFITLQIDLIEFPDWNPREISDKEFKKLQADIKNDPQFLIQRPPLINFLTKENRYICYAGNQRGKAAKANGNKEIGVWVEDDVPEQLQNERMLKDNLHRGEWDLTKLLQFDMQFLTDVGFGMKDLMKFTSSNDKEGAKLSLQERFIVPPFSVLDTRQGYWQFSEIRLNGININT